MKAAPDSVCAALPLPGTYYILPRSQYFIYLQYEQWALVVGNCCVVNCWPEQRPQPEAWTSRKCVRKNVYRRNRLQWPSIIIIYKGIATTNKGTNCDTMHVFYQFIYYMVKGVPLKTLWRHRGMRSLLQVRNLLHLAPGLWHQVSSRSCPFPRMREGNRSRHSHRLYRRNSCGGHTRMECAGGTSTGGCTIRETSRHSKSGIIFYWLRNNGYIMPQTMFGVFKGRCCYPATVPFSKHQRKRLVRSR